MRKTALLLAVVGLLLAASGGAAWAQEGGAVIGNPIGGKPSPPIPDYAYRDGEVYVDGDEVLDCHTFAESFDKGYDQWGNQKQARYVLAQCKRAGLPSADLPPEVRREIRQDALPETGGAPVMVLLSGLLLAGAGIGALHGAGRKKAASFHSPYGRHSPECAEGAFCEVYMQAAAYPPWLATIYHMVAPRLLGSSRSTTTCYCACA